MQDAGIVICEHCILLST